MLGAKQTLKYKKNTHSDTLKDKIYYIKVCLFFISFNLTIKMKLSY